MTSSARLSELAPPPASSGPRVDWEDWERSVGFSPPADYKRLIDAYGLGRFDGFLWVLHPSTANSNLRLDVAQIESARHILRNDSFGSNHELVPWASTDNGDVAYWVTNAAPDDPDAWAVAVNEARGPDWSVSDLTTIPWLEAVLSGRLKVDVFPDDFPSNKPVFEPFDFEK